MSVLKLKEILNDIDYPVLMEFVDYSWTKVDGSEIHWNTDNNIEDLDEGDGNTYSVELMNGESVYDGYLVVNADTGCGETVTYFFNLDKEV